MQPFLISEEKTGLYQYLEPWIRAADAYQPMINAYVYRGSVYRRKGYTYYGRMSYEDNIALGNGGKTYSGTLTLFPIVPGTFNPTDGIESFTDNGIGPVGTLTGSAGGTGTITYATGAWTLSFFANVANNTIIYGIYSPLLVPARPIMGIKLWTNELTDLTKLIVLDTRRASVFNTGTQKFIPIDTVVQTLWIGNGSSTSITINTSWSAVAPYTEVFAPYSISITDGTSTITDTPGVFPTGTLSSMGNFAAGGTVNYATGIIHLNFTVAPATTVTITLTASLSGDYFSGTTANFFNSVNWQGELYLTNNADPITVYNGSTNPGTLSRPPFSIDAADRAAFVNNIAKAIDVNVYKNRFLVLRPTIENAGLQNGIAPQSIRYSAILNPTNLIADVTGNGGELSAPTDDFIQGGNFLRDQLLVFFTNTTWTFRFTGSDFAPFRWDKLNSSKSCNAPYAIVDYDERITAMGSKGLIACDGVNVQRYDLAVIDQFLDINQNAFGQCYGLRFDNTNQTWMLYPSTQTIDTNGLSDSVLIYNFLENTWSTYNLPMSCLGIAYSSMDRTWADFAVGMPLANQYPNWAASEFSWDNFLNQVLSPILLGGGQDGVVYLMEDGTSDTSFMADGVTEVFTPISSSLTTTRWNPFNKIGQKVQFGWIDFYYSIDPENPPAILELTFMTDNSTAAAFTRTLTLDGPVNSDYAWKRIFVNNIGEFLQMNISSTSPANWKILGMVLWAKPAGRMTP